MAADMAITGGGDGEVARVVVQSADLRVHFVLGSAVEVGGLVLIWNLCMYTKLGSKILKNLLLWISCLVQNN